MTLKFSMHRSAGLKRLPLPVYAVVTVILCHLMSGEAYAVGGAPATKLINVADTRGMTPGLGRWIADVYNANLWLYGLIVISIMAGMGLILGLGFDRLVSLTGIDLGKLDHHE